MAPDILLARQTVAAEAAAWLGTPFHHHARIKGVGVDCAQLLIAVYAACGLVPDFDPGQYPTDWHLHETEERFLAHLLPYAAPIKHEPGQAYAVGDVYLWRFGRTYSHGSIAVSPTQVVHAYLGRGVILTAQGEEPLDGFAVRRFSLFEG